MSPLRASDPDEPVLAVHAGTVAYERAWTWQRQLAARRAADAIGDVLLTLEHPPVFTLGKSADRSHVLWDELERRARGVELHEVDRGGDVTYHGPGQLVGYPILKLAGIRNVVGYVRALEEICVRVAADLGVTAAPIEGYPGVWVGDDKLVAIGARVSSRGVTSHGFAMNVTTELDHFDGIVPCGIPDRGVCSFASLGVHVTLEEVLGRLHVRAAEVLGCTVVHGDLDDLGELVGVDVAATPSTPSRSAG